MDRRELWDSSWEHANGDIMASIDQSPTADRLVIADLTQEEAWLSSLEQAGVSLAAWR